MYNSETAVYRAYSYYMGWNMIIMKQQLYRKDDEIVSHGASRMPNSKSNNWWCEAFRTKATSDGTTIRDYRLDAHAHNPFCIGTMVVSSSLSKSIVAGCRNNVCNRLILHSKGLEQVCLVVTLSCSLHKCLYT